MVLFNVEATSFFTGVCSPYTENGTYSYKVTSIYANETYVLFSTAVYLYSNCTGSVLGVGSDDGCLASSQDGHEVAKCLAGARAGLHYE